MLRWFRRGVDLLKRQFEGDEPSGASGAAALVRYLSGRIPAPHRAEFVRRRVDEFLALREEERERALPAIYLLLEGHLVETAGGGEEKRESLRTEVRERYGALLDLPHVAPIFQPPATQELDLSIRLLANVLERAFDALGANGENLFPGLRGWIGGIPDRASLPVPFGVADELPRTHAEWLALLRAISHELHASLGRALGNDAADRMYRHSYDELVRPYGRLDTFSVVVGLLPDTVLDDHKIGLLNRDQMHRVLLDRVEHLQRANERLVAKNRELEQVHAELEAVRTDLERRVRERTSELRAEAEERKLAVEAQQYSETRFQRVVECLGEGIIITDLQDLILYVNGRMAELTGYAPDEMVGQCAYELLLPETDWDAARRRTERRAQRIPERYEVQVRRKDGSLIWVEVRAQPYVDHRGQIAGTLGTNTDITAAKRAQEEQQRLEEQIRSAQKLESLGVLAGGIAHDFNNLLTSMLGHAALAHRKLPPDSPARKNLEQIEIAAQRAADLTRQMLAYSGKGRFIVQSMDLTNLVEDMAHLLRSGVSKKATLQFDCGDSLPRIDADPHQMQQVIMNLVTNASDALGAEAGSITISTGATDITREETAQFMLAENLTEGTYVFLEVSDTGCGMDAETKARMFDPFFSTKFSGRGLGLAAVLGIIRGHGGAIRVRTDVGQGTAFRVLFPPSVRPEDRAVETARERVAWRGSGMFLVVDDEKYVRIITKTVLEEAGFTVITANDGRQGVDVFRQHADEIVGVLLDMTMPVMSGDEVFREMQKARPTVPVILSSGYSEDDMVRQLQVAGLAGFIQKPYQPQALVDKVREVLDR